MVDFGKIELFFDKLKEMRGIAELNRHLLRLLLKMQPDMGENTLKFLCLCFSLWDDGNTAVFSECWNRKWAGLKKLRESLDESFNSASADFDDFEEIVESGVAELTQKDFSSIVEVLDTDKFDMNVSHAPFIKRMGSVEKDGKSFPCLFLYMAKHFSAKLEIQESMSRLFKDGSEAAKKITKDDVSDCIEKIIKLTTRTDKNGNVVSLKLNEEQARAVLRGQKDNLVVTGGPGTGKTTVVLYILWNLLSSLVDKGRAEKAENAPKPEDVLCEYGIYLAAPSGKAADRMSESLKNGLNGIGDGYRWSEDPDRPGAKKESAV